MIFLAIFLSIVAFALRASRACQSSSSRLPFSPLTPAAAPALFPEALASKMWLFLRCYLHKLLDAIQQGDNSKRNPFPQSIKVYSYLKLFVLGGVEF
jgi:hypothetical protein